MSGTCFKSLENHLHSTLPCLLFDCSCNAPPCPNSKQWQVGAWHGACSLMMRMNQLLHQCELVVGGRANRCWARCRRQGVHGALPCRLCGVGQCAQAHSAWLCPDQRRMTVKTVKTSRQAREKLSQGHSDSQFLAHSPLPALEGVPQGPQINRVKRQLPLGRHNRHALPPGLIGNLQQNANQVCMTVNFSAAQTAEGHMLLQRKSTEQTKR